MKMDRKKTYIIAAGMVSALGRGVEANVQAVRSGRTGVSLHSGLLSDEDGNDVPVMCGQIPENVYSDIRRGIVASRCDGDCEDYTKTVLLAADALAEMFRGSKAAGGPSSGRQDRLRTAMVFSSTKGDIGIVGRVPEGTGAGRLPEDVFLDSTAKKIGRIYGFRQEDIFTVSNACISGVSSLVVAKRLIEYGKYDAVAVVGVDTLSEFIVSGFASFRSLSGELCRPYDASRCGLNLGEAAGALLLSSFPFDAVSPLVLSGGAVSDDANHISGPSRTGDGLYFAVRDAMEDAGVTADEVSFINLHGTATVYNDEMESKAVALAGLSSVPAQSLKPYIGHTLGASGVVETILCISQLKSGEVWGTPGYSEHGVPLPLNVSSSSRRISSRHCVKTASGFGGCNAAVVVSMDEYAGPLPEREPARFDVVRYVRLDGDTLPVMADTAGGDISFHSLVRGLYRKLGLDDKKFYKMDDMSKLGYLASYLLLEGISFSPEEMAVILQNRSSSLDSDLKHLKNITEGPGASPAVFVYTLPNVASGEISISHKIKGENTFFISSGFDRAWLEQYASMVMASSKARFCIVGWLEFLEGEYETVMELLRKC